MQPGKVRFEAPISISNVMLVCPKCSKPTRVAVRREGDKVWLIAENTDFSPIEVNLQEQELVIEGLSVGVIRR